MTKYFNIINHALFFYDFKTIKLIKCKTLDIFSRATGKTIFSNIANNFQIFFMFIIIGNFIVLKPENSIQSGLSYGVLSMFEFSMDIVSHSFKV